MLRAFGQDFRGKKFRHAEELEFDGIKAAVRGGVHESQRAPQILGMIAGDLGDEFHHSGLHPEFDARHRCFGRGHGFRT